MTYLGIGGGGVRSVAGRSGDIVLAANDISGLSVVNLTIGNTNGTIAAGDDPRIVGAIQASNNLSDLSSLSTARTNLGLSVVAVTGNYSDLIGAPTGGSSTSLNSPAFTGVPTAPTANTGTNTTQIATTAFVAGAVAASTTGVATFNSRTGNIILSSSDITGTGVLNNYALLTSPTFTGVVNAGTTNISGLLTLTSNGLALTSANKGIDIGSPNTVNTPFIEFHSGGNVARSFDAKITVTGGDASNDGKGNVAWSAGSYNVNAAAIGLNGVVTIPAGASIAGFAPLASPALTGIPTAPTAVAGSNTTQIATMAALNTAVSSLLGGAPPAALNTLKELADAINDDNNFAATVTTSLTGKLSKSSNLSDLANVATAKTNLGLSLVASSGSYNDLINIPAAYSLPIASTSVLGGVKVDGTSVTINNGVISSTTATYNPAAVTITGGTINNTSIGATTPSIGVFTTLNALTSLSIGSNNSTSSINSFFNGASGYSKQFTFQTNGLARWSFGASAAGESGNNNGSDFVIANWTDTGSYLSSPLTITRATGSVTMPVVNILGGTINNTPIGNNTASSGAFTSLSASGTVSGAGFTSLLSSYATTLSPTFTGVPVAPTAANGTSSTQIATTAFVASAVANTSFTLPTASTSVLGGVKIDGSSITISSGVISGRAVGTTAGTVAAGDDSRIVNALSTTVANSTYAKINSPVFTGTPTIPGYLTTLSASGIYATSANTNLTGTTTLGQQTNIGPQGNTIGGNILFNGGNGGWNYVASDYGWILRNDFPGVSFSVAASGSAGTVASLIQAFTVAPTGVMTINALSAVGGTIDNVSIGATTKSTGAFTTITGNNGFATGGDGNGNINIGPGGNTTPYIDFNGSNATGGVRLINDAAGRFTISANSFGYIMRFQGATVNSVTINGTLTANNINSTPIGVTTASTGAFTTLSASGTVSGTGFTNLLSSYAPINNAVLTGTAQVGTTTTTLGQQTITGTASGSTIGSNIIFNNGWKYVTSDYGWFIRNDFPGVSFNVTASGTAGSAATPIQAFTVSPTGAIFVQTPANGTNNTQIATTAFVRGAVGANALDFNIGLTQPGVTSNAQKLLVYTLPHAITLPANLNGSSAVALTAATASVAFVFAYMRNGTTTTIATFTFAANGTSATISNVNIPTLNAGDTLILTGPATADATLADIGFSILGSKQ